MTPEEKASSVNISVLTEEAAGATVSDMARKPSGRPHRKPIQVKLSEEERTELDAAAQARQLDTSTWMREVCLRAARRIASATEREEK